jgi:hypothetical protein
MNKKDGDILDKFLPEIFNSKFVNFQIIFSIFYSRFTGHGV